MTPESERYAQIVEWHGPPASSQSEWRNATTVAIEAGEVARCPTGDGGTLRFLFRSEPQPHQS